MDSIHPWLDANEVRKFADRLMSSNRPPTLAEPDPGFSNHFVGFTALTESAPHSPEDVVEAAPVPVVPPRLLNFGSAAGEGRAQIESIRDSLSSQYEAADTFVVGQSGDVIFNQSGEARLHFLAFGFLGSQTTAKHLHLKISAEVFLVLIRFENAAGKFVLGTILKTPLTPAEATNLGDSLAATWFGGSGEK